MKRNLSLTVFAVLICCIGLLYLWLILPTDDIVLMNPVSFQDRSGNEVVNEDTHSNELNGSFRINCVLSFGTYLVSVSECDELTLTDLSPDPNMETMSCTLSDGTFLLSGRECDILRNSSGSRDVMKTLD